MSMIRDLRTAVRRPPVPVNPALDIRHDAVVDCAVYRDGSRVAGRSSMTKHDRRTGRRGFV